jgi:hypothetical protein
MAGCLVAIGLNDRAYISGPVLCYAITSGVIVRRIAFAAGIDKKYREDQRQEESSLFHGIGFLLSAFHISCKQLSLISKNRANLHQMISATCRWIFCQKYSILYYKGYYLLA